MPTAHEINWLINREEDELSSGDGVADGTYTRPNTWTTGTGENTGLKIISKYTGTNLVAGDVQSTEALRTLYFPNVGYRTSGSGSTATTNVGSTGSYWSSDQDNATNAYDLYFYSDRTAGLPVRCVRD